MTRPAPAPYFDALRSAARLPALLLIALMVALAPSLAGCGSDEAPEGDEIDEMGVDGPFAEAEPLGKADSAGVPGPAVMTDTRATQVWTARNGWEDTNTPAARAAGMAWGADSGLTWDQKYQLWVAGMERTDGYNTYFETFMLTTPFNGKTLPAPKLECAELAIFLRITFASWYELPWYITSVDSKGVRVYFGHFGARTKSQRYKSTPNYGWSYQDHSGMTAEQYTASWPQDAKLRERGLYGGQDTMDYVFEGAMAGAYFDEIYLNKRVGHFMRLVLAYFGSMNLADSRNTYNLVPESVQPGDVLVERWQRTGIGHTLVVKSVEPLEGGQLEATLASGSMPRRQPNWETPTSSKYYFTLNKTGGEGENSDGDEYVKLGGGIKRWRATKNINGYWTNTWMQADESSWVSDSDWDELRARPGRFDQILGEADPEQLRDAVVAMIEAKRNHLREYPASCSARIGREEAFDKLYEVMQERFGVARADVDQQYRTLEDYVFAELEYTESKTCCWNSSTAAMYQIAMEYNQSLMEDSCVDPVVFKNDNGYQVFQQYAEQTGRGHLWKEWSADESCPQSGVAVDTEVETDSVAWCDINQGGVGPSGCTDDGFEENDALGSPHELGAGNHQGLMICSGDDDFYGLSVGGGLSASISFNHSDGDLDLELYRDGGSVDSSTSTSDSESVSGDGSGSYVVRVYGYQGAQGSYSLNLTAN